MGRGSRLRRLRSLRRGWRPVARSAMTPPGPTRGGTEPERSRRLEKDDVIFLVSPVVTLLRCDTDDGDAIPGHRGFSVIRAHGTSHAHPVLRFGSVSNGRSFLNVHDAMITKLLDLIRQGRLRRRAAPPLRGGRKPTARRGASLMREKHERHPDDRPVFARQTFALPVVFLPGATTHANISPSRSAERAIEAGIWRVEATSREHETEHDAAYPGYVVLVVSFSFVFCYLFYFFGRGQPLSRGAGIGLSRRAAHF